MSVLSIRRALAGALLLCCAVLSAASVVAQSKPGQPEQGQDDVVRVNTELVQTDVMVFDKRGRFVDGLKPEQFALRVDNKPQTIAFFERVTSGSLRAQPNPQTNAETPLSSALVRVGVRDLKNDRIGSAMKWIEVPNISAP